MQTVPPSKKPLSSGKIILIVVGILFLIGIIKSRSGKADESINGTSLNNTAIDDVKKELTKAEKDSIKAEEDLAAKADAIAQQKWDNSKAGRIKEKHPEWTKDECEDIANHKIWIGMSIEMLKYERGTPNSANPSNYGSGTEWQWCWDDYTPSCFYGADDGIITSYN